MTGMSESFLGGLQAFAHFVAVHLRHVDVQQNQIRRILHRRRQRQPAQWKRTHFMPLLQSMSSNSFRLAGLSSTIMMSP
jgi:hypothetical protein